MDFSLNDEQRAIQETAREFARREVDPIVDEIDEKQKFPRDVMAKAGSPRVMDSKNNIWKISESGGPPIQVTKHTSGSLFWPSMAADGKTINGTWTQQGMPAPLDLTRAIPETAWTIPEPPPPPKRMRSAELLGGTSSAICSTSSSVMVSPPSAAS